MPRTLPSSLAASSIAAAVAFSACASNPSPVAGPAKPPSPGDEQAEAQFRDLRARAEAGEAVDFRALRLAWLHGPGSRHPEMHEQAREQRRAMRETMDRNGDPKVVLAMARQILDLCYVDLEAQKARRQACELLGDKPCAERGHAIEMGLLKSVIAGGDGKSCATAWSVVTIDEEYFVIRMVDARFVKQSLVSEGARDCDAMLVDRDGHRQTMYFDVTEMMNTTEAKLREPPPSRR